MLAPAPAKPPSTPSVPAPALFGPGALRLCAIAARGLGWRPGEFWQATPAELAAAFGPLGEGTANLSRSDLTHMMEHDNG